MYDYRVAEHGWHGKAANVALTHVTKKLTNRWKSIATRTTKMVSNKMTVNDNVPHAALHEETTYCSLRPLHVRVFVKVITLVQTV